MLSDEQKLQRGFPAARFIFVIITLFEDGSSNYLRLIRVWKMPSSIAAVGAGFPWSQPCRVDATSSALVLSKLGSLENPPHPTGGLHLDSRDATSGRRARRAGLLRALAQGTVLSAGNTQGLLVGSQSTIAGGGWWPEESVGWSRD